MEGLWSNDPHSCGKDTLAVAECCSVPLEIRKQLERPLRPWQTRLLRIHASTERVSSPVCDLLVADMIAFPGVGLIDESMVVKYEALSAEKTFRMSCEPSSF
jgi:hypothetical protein